jgi:hypothetical protein
MISQQAKPLCWADTGPRLEGRALSTTSEPGCSFFIIMLCLDERIIAFIHVDIWKDFEQMKRFFSVR